MPTGLNTGTVLGVVVVAALVALAGCGGGSKSDSQSAGGRPVNAARQAAIVAEQIQRFESGPGELSNVTCHPGAGTYACDATWELASDSKQIQITATMNGNYFQATSPQVQQDFSASGAIPTDTAYRGLNLHGLQAWMDGHAAAAGFQSSPDPKGCTVGKVDRTFSCTVQTDPSHITSVPFRVAADGRVTIANADPEPQNAPSNAGKDLGFLPKSPIAAWRWWPAAAGATTRSPTRPRRPALAPRCPRRSTSRGSSLACDPHRTS